jgi:hypothetical protein
MHGPFVPYRQRSLLHHTGVFEVVAVEVGDVIIVIDTDDVAVET